MWLSLVAEMWMTSPCIAFTKGEYSRSGSMIITSALGSVRMMFVISSFAVNDLPAPDTPRIKELPFKRWRRLAIIMFLEITFCP